VEVSRKARACNRIEKENEMEEFTIKRDNEPDLVITGVLLARVSSSPNLDSSGFSGSTFHWEVLRLYITNSGKYVCVAVARTEGLGEDRHRAAVCDTPECVCKFFGWSWLVQELYDDAGIDCP
jgi:hypothetical protein